MDYYNTQEKLDRAVSDLGNREFNTPITIISLDRECLERGIRYSTAELAEAIVRGAHKGRIFVESSTELIKLRKIAEAG